MYLSQIKLKNFRSFADEKVPFEQRLTVLVGENNGGKSNLIDAIRLVSTPLSGRREIYCEQTDIRFSAVANGFDIEATFDDLTPPQQGRLISAASDDTLGTASFGLTYEVSGTQSHIRPNLWAGRFKTPPEPGSHEMIRHVYLPPLRDAKRALASGNPTRIHALLKHFLSDRDPDELAEKLARTSDDQILQDIDLAVDDGLDILTAGVRRQSATLGFNTDEKLIDIARDLRFKLADYGIAPEDLQYSGHGFANLLYIATIAVELDKTDNAELTLFLVEEPEAHLHPQLQAAVLNFLEERAEQSISREKKDPYAPAGHIQVVVATHSPNLSAWVPNRNLVFVRSIPPTDDKDDGTAGLEIEQANDPEIPQAQAESRAHSRCIPLSKLDLSGPERRKIDRYLDVTKSALLFGGRVLLVEGIAEALLLPVIAKYHVLKDDASAFRTFRSAVFVPIEGVDFAPYAKALLSPYKNVRIADRLVIITDGDTQSGTAENPLPGRDRKYTLDALAAEKGADAVMNVFINTYSLEAELVEAGNADFLKAVYLCFHPQSEDKWDEAVAKTDDARARAIQDLFKTTPKGDFAQLLAEKAAGPSFVVPEYIRQAIKALVE